MRQKAPAEAVLEVMGGGRNLGAWVQTVPYFTDEGSGGPQGSEGLTTDPLSQLQAPAGGGIGVSTWSKVLSLG